jgi:hypothetical protein
MGVIIGRSLPKKGAIPSLVGGKIRFEWRKSKSG